MSLQNYKLRLDNSICDIVRLKTPNNMYEADQVTPKPKEWIDKVFPYLYAVTYCHINPSETDRKIWIYCNSNKESWQIGKHEKEISNFEVTPKILWDLFKNHDYRKDICVTRLDNLEYVLPNLVKREKILNDGKTYCLVADLENNNFEGKMKESLRDYNFADKDTSFVPQENVNIGKVTGVDIDSLYPIKVEFPNGYKASFIAEDLMLYHEV